MKRLRLRDFISTDACHFARVELPLAARPDLHTHDFSELFWVEAGSGIHRINGEERRLRAGMLIFIRPTDGHGFAAERQGQTFTICNLAFSVQTWRAMRDRHGLDWFDAKAIADRERFVTAPTFDFLRHAGDEWLTAPRSMLRLERFVLNLAAALEDEGKATRVGAPSWLLEALTKLERERLFREGPPALTRLAGRSQEHVVREVRRWFRKTPSALINEMRMRFAAQCLSSTSREIVDICFDCGLENLGHFYNLFQKAHGTTPRQYRLLSQAAVKPF